MQKLILVLAFWLAGASLCGQSTEINVTALLKPGANSTFLLTNSSGNVVWGNAATLLTAGTGISISSNTVSVNNIPETSIQDGSVLARVAGNENISGTWQFNSILLMKDAQSSFYDDSDNTKQMRFQLSGVNTGTTRNLTVPNADGTVALTSNSSGLVDLTTSVTGTLPGDNGGTGTTSFGAANRIPIASSATALTNSANLTFNSSTNRLAAGLSGNSAAGADLNGTTTLNLGSPVLTSGTQLFRLNGTPSTATNNLNFHSIYASSVISNDGTPTGGANTGIMYEATISSPTRLANATGISTSIINNSENLSGTLYGIRASIRDYTTAASLDNRTALSFDIDKFGDAVDMHVGRGVQGRVRDLSSTGRWLSAFASDLQVSNALTGYGASISVSNTRGTGNTQYGINIANTSSGSGTTVTNAYGVNLVPSAVSSGVMSNYFGVISTSDPANIGTAYGLYFSAAGWRNYINGNLSLGGNSNTARLFVRGSGNTNSTTALTVENSSSSNALTILNDATSGFGGSPVASYRLASHGAFTTNDGVVRALGSGSQSSLSSASVFVENSGGNRYTLTTTDAGHFRIYLNNTLLTTQIRLSNLEFRHFATGAFGPSNSSIEGGGLVYTDSLASDAITAAENKRANGSADAVLYAKTASSGGDAKIKLEAGSVLWTLGNDISDGALKIGNQDDPGTSPVAAILSTSVQVNTQIFSNKFALTDGSTIAVNWNNGNAQSVTLGGNRTVTFANPKSGAVYRLYLKQDGTGNRTVTWPTIKWQGGSAPTLTTAANKTDIITIIYDGTDYFGSASLNY